MATRQETQQRKQALLEGLRAAYREGQGVGEQALSLRALSDQYQLSMQTVGVQLQQLVREGVLYTVPRVGTFMGRPPLSRERPYLLVSDLTRDAHMFLDQVQTGFEDRVAQLGGSSFSLCFRNWREDGDPLQMPLPAGALVFGRVNKGQQLPSDLHDVPKVVFGDETPGDLRADVLNFDDEGGAAAASRHLAKAGHRKIAFLALHDASGESGVLRFSARREAGWRKFLVEIGQDPHTLVFRPRKMDPHHQVESVRGAVEQLLLRSDITAVVSVNAFTSRALLEGLEQSGLPPERWPAMVGFDDTPRARAAGLTYMRLPWDKLGAEAAQLLWERATGRLTGDPVVRQVPMHLIARLTCRPDWAQVSGGVRHRMLSDHAEPMEFAST